MLFLKNKIKIKAVGYVQLFIFVLADALTGCGGGGGGSSNNGGQQTAPSVPSTVTISAPALPANNQLQLQCPTVSAFSVASPPQPSANTISGRVTFDRILFFPWQPNPGLNDPSGLNYANQEVLPARGVVIEALASSDGAQCSGPVVATAVTDGDGWYQLTPAGSANICVRVRAQLYRIGDGSSAANWNFAVADNTASNALYVMTEASAASINDRPRRDLHAASGWMNGSYSAARVAAPFAILDTVCKAMDAVLTARAVTQFGSLTYFWSTKNTSDKNGTLQQGKIGGSFFDPNTVSIYLRGDAEVNTDEFDEMVIAHEFGHFVTHTLSRSDSVGGSHSLLDYEDPRLAFDEGWATAFAGLALHTSIYRDSDEVSTPNSPSREFSFDILQHYNVPTGWFSESSMQRALYTLGSSADDGGTGVGLGALLQTFAGNYKQTDSLASIFSYGEKLKSEQNTFANAIASVLDMEQINGDSIAAFADNENNAPSQFDLPVYTLIDTLGSKQQVCSSNAYGTQNTLSNRRYMRFIPPQTARYRFNIQPVNTTNSGGIAGFELLDRGHTIAYQEDQMAGAALTVLSGSALQGGRSYVLGIFHTGNVIENTNVAAGDQCFWVSAVTAP